MLCVDDDVKCYSVVLDRQTLDLFLEAGAEDCLLWSVEILVRFDRDLEDSEDLCRL